MVSERSSSFATIISKLAVMSISVGLAAMILAFFILGGFRQTIESKVYDFKGHLEIVKYSLGHAREEKPVSLQSDFYRHHEKYTFIDHVQPFALKAGLIKTPSEVEGVLFKGVNHHFDTARFRSALVEGRFLNFEKGSHKEAVLSRRLATKLMLEVGDDLVIHFVQHPPRVRKLKVVGLYETGLEEFDKNIAIGSLSIIQKLNGWSQDEVGGFEVFVKDTDQIDESDQRLFHEIDNDLYVAKVSERYSQIFDWLDLLNQNARLFLGLILIVACFNMISILLILILERTYMIGVLGTLGTSKKQIKRIFMLKGISLIAKGLLYGNLVALLLAYLQDRFHVIALDAESYYMHYVPILWDVASLLGINGLTFLTVSLALRLPISVIARIRPVAAIRFS